MNDKFYIIFFDSDFNEWHIHVKGDELIYFNSYADANRVAEGILNGSDVSDVKILREEIGRGNYEKRK